jgi:hypothetical protein
MGMTVGEARATKERASDDAKPQCEFDVSLALRSDAAVLFTACHCPSMVNVVHWRH